MMYFKLFYLNKVFFKFCFVSICLLIGGSLLSACALIPQSLRERQEERLPGRRIPVVLNNEQDQPVASSKPVQLIQARNLTTWSQVGGNAQHAAYHIAARQSLGRIWSRDIGRGNASNTTLTGQPLIVQNVVFAMDSRDRVTALNLTNGDILWQVRLNTGPERDGFFGGGLAYANGKIYVATGFQRLITLRARDGQEAWRQRLPGPAHSAPTFNNNFVYVATLNNKLTAFNAETGRKVWEHQGEAEATQFVGSAAPASSDDTLVSVYSSGEVFALDPRDGRELWSDTLASISSVGLISDISHIRALPVIDRDLLFVSSNAGKLAAFNLRRGRQVWEASFGGVQTPVIGGTHLYFMDFDGTLVAIDRETGGQSWVKQFESKRDTTFSYDKPITWYGPLLVGGRLLVSNSEGRVVAVNPIDGKTFYEDRLPGGAALSPVAANGTVVFTTTQGRLVAYR